jgi:hypothetical protein
MLFGEQLAVLIAGEPPVLAREPPLVAVFDCELVPPVPLTIPPVA